MRENPGTENPGTDGTGTIVFCLGGEGHAILPGMLRALLSGVLLRAELGLATWSFQVGD